MPIYTERPAGIYRSTYLGCSDKDMENKDTGELEPRWIWRFQELSDPTTNGQIDKITQTSLRSANSNAYKMAAGILGHKPQPGDDTEAHVGETYDVVYGPNQAGTLTITSVVAVKATNAGPAADAAAAQHAAQEGDDLPF